MHSAHREPLARVTDLRERIDGGLSWQQLGETLEELRDLFSQASSSLDSRRTDYLERVNDDLAQICQQLGNVLAVSSQSTALAEPSIRWPRVLKTPPI